MHIYMQKRPSLRRALLVAGEGFEPSKAEPGDLQSSALVRDFLVTGYEIT